MNVLGFLRDSAWDKMDAVQYYRTYLPLREINNHNPEWDVKCIGNDKLSGMTDDELGGRDIYTMCRMYQVDGCQKFVDELHRRGGVLVLDADDDMTETYRLVSGRGDEFKKVLGIADYVSVSEQPLAELFSKYTKKPPRVLLNCVDSVWMKTVADASRRIVGDGMVTMGFSGSPTHWGDWYLPAVPFARIGREYQNVQLLTHGEVPRYMNHVADSSSLYKLGQVPFSIYPVLLNQFDVMLCAVDSRDRFNAGKSAAKALECMALGVVPVCSNFPPYLVLAEQGAPIYIIEEESQDGWYEAMRTMVENEELRKHMSSLGPDWVQENRDMCVSGYKQWESFYNDILGGYV